MAGVINAHHSQQHEGLHHAVCQLQQEVARPKIRLKSTLPKKSGVERGQFDQIGQFLKVLGDNFSL